MSKNAEGNVTEAYKALLMLSLIADSISLTTPAAKNTVQAIRESIAVLKSFVDHAEPLISKPDQQEEEA